MNYAEAGVDVDFAEHLLKTLTSKILINDSILKMNDYCSCIDFLKLEYKNPILTLSTDGVGSKLLLAEQYPNIFSNIAQDLFAMVFNDIICSGSKPLYMLDYYATHSLKENSSRQTNRFSEILNNLVSLCNKYDIGLVGGETAELPIIYSVNKFDLAGFGVGIVEKENLIHKDKVKAGDVIIGFQSSGPHSNGFALINKLIDKYGFTTYFRDLHGSTTNFIKSCLKPTKIYIHDILNLMKVVNIHGIAHITGGGFNNISRILPENLAAHIDLDSWLVPEIFDDICHLGDLSLLEMLKIFNCGIGMIVIVDKKDVDSTLFNVHNSNVIGVVKQKETESLIFGGTI
jgi:phosphoribosylformylglycinamidine cyclo-ligase